MKKKSYKILCFLAVLCLLVSTVVFTGCGNKEEEKTNQVVENEQDEVLDEKTDDKADDKTDETIEDEDTKTEDSQENTENKTESKNEVVDDTETETDTKTETSIKTETSGKTETSTTTKNETTNTNSNTNTNANVNTNTSTETEKKDVFKTGTYKGSHKQQAMGSELTYTYSMQFNGDNTYSYSVSFVVGEETYTETEKGTYAVSGTAISLTNSEGTAMSGTFAGNTVQITRMVSSFSFDPMTIKLKQ